MNLSSLEAVASGATALILGVALLTAAFGDAMRFRIPNAVVLFIALLFIPAAWLGSAGEQGWLSHLGAGLLMFAIGYGLFSLRVFGGGDAKLMAAMALWTGLAGLSRFALLTALFGGVLAVILLLLRRLDANPTGRFAHLRARNAPVPYGIAISAAGLDWLARHMIEFVRNLPF